MPATAQLGEFGAVIFDWDGVLVDSATNYYRAYELVLQEIGIATTPREIYLREGEPTPKLIAALCRERGIEMEQSGVQALVERRRRYDAALGPRRFFDGVWDLISRLRNSGLKIGVVTGSSRKSVHLALGPEQEKVLDALITADEVTLPKPDPQPFHLASEVLGLAPARCVVVENAPFGIQSARRAGCRVIGLCTTLPAEDLGDANWIVANHAELGLLLSGNSRVVSS